MQPGLVVHRCRRSGRRGRCGRRSRRMRMRHRGRLKARRMAAWAAAARCAICDRSAACAGVANFSRTFRSPRSRSNSPMPFSFRNSMSCFSSAISSGFMLPNLFSPAGLSAAPLFFAVTPPPYSITAQSMPWSPASARGTRAVPLPPYPQCAGQTRPEYKRQARW